MSERRTSRVAGKPEQARAFDAQDAELALVGCILLGPSHYEQAAAIVSPQDFSAPGRAHWWKVLGQMRAGGESIDPLTLADRTGTDKLALLEALDRCAIAAHATAYAKIVRDKSCRRSALALSKIIAALAEESDDPLSAALAAAEAAQRVNAANDAVGCLMSEVAAERVEWLWEGRVAVGKLAVLDGDPGLGKSTLALDLAARVSRGRAMPGAVRDSQPAGVVILNAEDGLADTVRPRLDVAGADCSRVLALQGVSDADGVRPLSIPRDLCHVKAAIERVQARLVLIDPLMAYLGSDTNSHRDQDVRRALFPLTQLAEDSGAAVLLVRHLNKAVGGNPLYRGGGSIGIIGAARIGLLVARDPDDPTRRVLATTKCNVAAESESLSFHLEEETGVSRVVWDGSSQHQASALLGETISPEERGALEDAKDVIADILRNGPVAAAELQRKVMEQGVTDHTFRRARKSLGCVKSKSGMSGCWTWQLPSNLPTAPRTCPPSGDGQIRRSWASSATLEQLGAEEISA